VVNLSEELFVFFHFHIHRFSLNPQLLFDIRRRHSCCLDHGFAVLDGFLANDRVRSMKIASRASCLCCFLMLCPFLPSAVFVDPEDVFLHLFFRSHEHR
jgi:hypothetical protein